MPLLAMVLTLPLIYLAYDKAHQSETLYKTKLFGIWLSCQLYITINNSLRIPLGLIISFIIIWNEPTNKISKFTALIVGFVSFITSTLVYLIYRL